MPEWLQTIGILGGLLVAVSMLAMTFWIIVFAMTGGLRERINRRKQEEEEIEDRFLDRMQDFK
jgi:hypothetical protein